MSPHRLAAAVIAALTILITSQAPAHAAPTPTPKGAATVAPRTAEPRTDPRYYDKALAQNYAEARNRNPWLGAYLEGKLYEDPGGWGTLCGSYCWGRHENGIVVVSSSSVPSADTTGWGHAIRYPLAQRYLGWFQNNTMPVGHAVTDSFCGLAQGGCGVHTTGGSVYWSPNTGTHWVRGRIKDRWNATGWENGRLGYPISDEFCGLRDGGCGTHFQNGSIYWTPGTDAWDVGGLFFQVWRDSGWENGWLRYPTGPEVRSGDVVTQQFQGGWLSYNFRTGQLQQNRR
ncbi:LGFP repeat-containing protein [Enemella evansiae]|uniref:LGFP repeat-containing protein n=1 Tax=Enemella evansiae TaxID=2016499 RepID=UPI000B9639B9|nr:hypothetical protein [Enemella evansiae]OYO07743.1 hypothetical protein BI335_20475 [Enemella evansiae]TDO86006.1 LGFP repeat-containing protein [Enemella evansiae]